jgi:hypothetical protein
MHQHIYSEQKSLVRSRNTKYWCLFSHVVAIIIKTFIRSFYKFKHSFTVVLLSSGCKAVSQTLTLWSSHYQTNSDTIFISVWGPWSVSVFLWIIIIHCLSTIFKFVAPNRHFIFSENHEHSLMCGKSHSDLLTPACKNLITAWTSDLE